MPPKGVVVTIRSRRPNPPVNFGVLISVLSANSARAMEFTLSLTRRIPPTVTSEPISNYKYHLASTTDEFSAISSAPSTPELQTGTRSFAFEFSALGWIALTDSSLFKKRSSLPSFPD